MMIRGNIIDVTARAPRPMTTPDSNLVPKNLSVRHPRLFPPQEFFCLTRDEEKNKSGSHGGFSRAVHEKRVGRPTAGCPSNVPPLPKNLEGVYEIMSGFPFMKFFPRDWIADTSHLSLRTCGGWIKLICAMHFSPEYGKLDWTLDQIKIYLGEEWEWVLKELSETRVAEVSYQGVNGVSPRVTVMSRRMIREEHQRKRKVKNKRDERHRNVTANSPGRSQKPDSKDSTVTVSYGTKSVLNKNQKSPPSGSVHKYQEITLEGICMGRSMNLIPALKEIADKLYNSDTEKFKRLAKWINQGRKYNHLEENMAIALWGLWEALQNPKVEVLDWYPYADKILDDVEKDRGAAASDREHQRHKDEVREFVEKLGKDKF